MPIKNNDTVIPQIMLKDQKIYRVYKGTELEHGVFNATYNTGPGYVGKQTEEFTWGIGIDNLPTASCADASFKGWYGTKSLNNQVSNITEDIKTDTSLYAYFEKSKTQYSGNYQWTEETSVWHEGTSGQSFDPLSEGVYYTGQGFDCFNWAVYRSRTWLGADLYGFNMYNTASTSSTPKAGALARWSIDGLYGGGHMCHIAFVEKVYDDGTPLYSHGGYSGYTPNAYVTTRSGNHYTHMGYFYTSLCYQGGSEGYYETVTETKTAYADWQDSSSPPSGSWQGSPSTRTVSSHYDYNINNWTTYN